MFLIQTPGSVAVADAAKSPTLASYSPVPNWRKPKKQFSAPGCFLLIKKKKLP